MTDTRVDWSCGPGYKHPKFVRGLALQLWGLKCSRDFRCVEVELEARAVEDGLTCVPDIRTLRSWAASEDWSGEVARMMRSIAPDIMGGMVVDLIMGASEGAPWLRQVLNGSVPKPNTARVRAILTALSMVGVPELAHSELTSALGQGDGVGVDAPSLAIDSGLGDGDWKQRLAHRVGLSDPPLPDDPDC